MDMSLKNEIFTFENGIKVFYVLGRGLIIYFPYYEHHGENNEDIQPSFKQHIGDKWIFNFDNTDMASVIAEVRGIEIANSFLQPYSSYGLCFGGIFTEEHKKQMKIGSMSFRKIINNTPIDVTKNNINLVKLGD